MANHLPFRGRGQKRRKAIGNLQIGQPPLPVCLLIVAKPFAQGIQGQHQQCPDEVNYPYGIAFSCNEKIEWYAEYGLESISEGMSTGEK